MNFNATFHVFGKSTVKKNWNIVNRENINIFHYVLSGSATYIFENKEYTMIPGHIYILPYSAKCVRKTIDDIPFEHIFFDFLSPTLPDKIIDIDVSDYKDMKYTLKALTEFFDNVADDEGNFWYFPFKDDNQYILDTSTLYFQIIMNLIDKISPLYNKFDQRILSVVNYIHKHYSDTLSIQQLADYVYLEKNYFVKLFKKYMNVPPHTYIRTYRLNIAVSMIKSGLSVNDVFEKCGYQSISAFSSAIKNEFGMSPSQIRLENSSI